MTIGNRIDLSSFIQGWAIGFTAEKAHFVTRVDGPMRTACGKMIAVPQRDKGGFIMFQGDNFPHCKRCEKAIQP